MSANKLLKKLSNRLDGHPPASLDWADRRVARFSFSSFRLEAAVALLLVATVASIAYHDQLLRKTLVISPHNAGSFGIHAYGDDRLGGNSTIAENPQRPLSWSCTLRDKYQHYFCGYEILFDKQRLGKGANLTDYDSVKLAIRYEGPAEWVRFYVKNFDPRYSDVRDRDSTKFNIIEFLDRPGRQDIEVKLTDFSVAQWWLLGKRIPPELSQAQFDNVVALDIQPGTGARPGQHRFQVESIVFEGALLSSAQWYLCLLGFWVVAICGFLAHRMINLKREFEAKRRAQEIESRQLQTAMAAAEDASRAKSQFLASMSHELRTPLNAILGYAQLLQREDLTERQAGAVRTIHQSGSHLLTLITDVLDLAKIEAGKLELSPGSMDLRSCVNSIADMIGVRAQEKDLEFSFAMPDDLPRFIVADEKRLRQVLINLAGNAVKFTNEGGVSLTVSRIGGSKAHPRIRFQVCDTGPGIDADKQALIFRPFEQAGNDKGRDAGTGLGLSISNQIIALMGSRIEVESSPGSGSRFWFDLDVQLAERAEAMPASGKGAITGYSGPRRKLLIVDDTAENRAVLAAMVEQLGFEVAEACDGAESIGAAEREKPDLVLMDMRMPVMDGFEAIRQLRRMECGARIPIIAVSASATDEFEIQSQEAGADAFLAKPVDHEELVQLLVWHLKLEWIADSGRTDADERRPLVPPPAEQMAILHELALAGNMRAIRQQAEQIGALDPQYGPFADTLQTLASTFQSPAILRLIEQYSRQAA